MDILAVSDSKIQPRPVCGCGGVAVHIVVLEREIVHSIAGVCPGFLCHFHILTGVHHFDHSTVVRSGDAELDIGENLQWGVPLSAFCGYQDYSVGAVGTVYRCLVRILEDRYRFYFIRIKERQRADRRRHSCHHIVAVSCVVRSPVNDP